MKVIVVDNSVIMKPILEEDDADKVKKLFLHKDRFELSILVPDIFCYEFLNILTKAVGTESALKAYNYLKNRQLSVIPFEDDLIKIAGGLVKKYPQISFYDAAYHALAIAHKADLITADERYYNLTKGEGRVKLLSDFKVNGD